MSGSQSEPKRARLRSRRDFKAVYQAGQSVAGKYIVLYYVRTEDGLRAGFSTSRGIPQAVARNRIRRLLRASWRLLESDVSSGADLVLVGRRAAAQAGQTEIQDDLDSLLRKVRLKDGGQT